MRDRKGGFLTALIFNMGLNIMYSVPAWILLALHFWLGIPIWLFWLTLGMWIGGIIIWMLVIRWSANCSSEPTLYRENKNPYSAKAYKPKIKESDKNDSENNK